jgi:hypothetical protein
MPDKLTSEQTRQEAAKLRETAVKLMKLGAALIKKSAALGRGGGMCKRPRKGTIVGTLAHNLYV